MTAGRQLGAARPGLAGLWPPLAKCHFRFHVFPPRWFLAKLTPLDAFCLKVRTDGLPRGIAIDGCKPFGLETLSVEARESATWENQAKTDAHHAVEGLLREKDVPSANHGT